jgi:hypothetical protein
MGIFSGIIDSITDFFSDSSVAPDSANLAPLSSSSTDMSDLSPSMYCASIKLAGARHSRWQRITRHLDHAADDCRWQALRLGLIVAGRQ